MSALTRLVAAAAAALVLVPCTTASAASAPAPATAVGQLSTWRQLAGLGPVSNDSGYSSGCRDLAEYHRRTGATAPSEVADSPWYTPAGDEAARNSVLAYGPLGSGGPRIWERAVYHRAALFNPRLRTTGYWSEFGMACMRVNPLDPSARTTGATAFPYPYDGQDSVSVGFACDEWPNPCENVPGWSAGNRIGFPISLSVNGPWPRITGSRILSATLTTAGGTAVRFVAEDACTGRNGAYLSGGAALLPAQPLAGGTTYTVSVQLRVFGGTPACGTATPADSDVVQRTWSFRTAGAPRDAAVGRSVGPFSARSTLAGRRLRLSLHTPAPVRGRVALVTLLGRRGQVVLQRSLVLRKITRVALSARAAPVSLRMTVDGFTAGGVRYRPTLIAFPID